MSKKIIFVGPENIHSAFQAMGTYDFQEPVTSLDDFKTQMRLDDTEAAISKDSAVIMLFSRLFLESPDDFANIAAFYSPYAVITILIPAGDRKIEDKMRERIKSVQKSYAKQLGGIYENDIPIYFIAYESPMPDLQLALEDYVNNENLDELVRKKVSLMLGNEEEEDEQIEETEEETEDEQDSLYGVDTHVTIDEKKETDGKVITVTSSKGGSGKSTITMILSAYLSLSSKLSQKKSVEEKSLKVCVVDLDIRDGQLGFLNGQMDPNIFHIIQSANGVKPSHEDIKKGVYTSPSMDVDFIFAPRRTRHAVGIRVQFYANLIARLREMYDIVILDTGVNYLDDLQEKVVYPMSDQILLVSDMTIQSIMGMTRWIEEVAEPDEDREAIVNKDKVNIIINKVMKGVNMDGQNLKQASKGIPVISMIPSLPTTITYNSNTSSLEKSLAEKAVSLPFKRIAEHVVDDYELSPLPYKQ